jgi:hypothetical protein
MTTAVLSALSGGGAAAGGAAAAAGFGLRDAVALAAGGLQIYGGIRGYQQAQTQANFEAFNARSEEIAGQQAANDTRARLLKSLASQNASFGAAGIDVGSGSPQDVMAETSADGERELATLKNQTILRAGGRRQQADALRAQGTSALIGGVAGAAGTLFDYVDRKSRIGTVPSEPAPPPPAPSARSRR